jgi:hypothetical protein
LGIVSPIVSGIFVIAKRGDAVWSGSVRHECAANDELRVGAQFNAQVSQAATSAFLAPQANCFSGSLQQEEQLSLYLYQLGQKASKELPMAKYAPDICRTIFIAFQLFQRAL